MLIKSITTEFTEKWGKKITRTLNYGQYKNYHITVDNFKDSNGRIESKRFVIWNNTMQKIVNKFRNKDGKFDRFG